MKAVVVPVTPFQQNCTVIWCEETMMGAVSDPGGDIDRVQQAIDEQGVTVEKILVTHGHMDHAGGVAELSERLGVPIEGPHEDDLFLIEGLSEAGAKYGLTEARPFTPTRWLKGGDTVSFGNETMSVRHCPGHTPGHVIFHDAKAMVALVGDVLFQGSIGRSDLPGGDHDTLIRSIREQLWPLGDATTFVSGHGGLSTFGDERQSNPFVADQLFSD
ncbi:MAG: MBL fold metallo-hydrolase [Rhodospirillaceae bacterium]|jgi:glyoxylase-like metal-dependent hydrolase (beta-lactamase superfamily II)|nr:MBL fold metallo-hydrolase [Rhodospirillaceae bacterium]MBT4045500.1 MBL fold metallo-hydrolase [Rhodospirillaceae bacterium]MBT4687581.1 MBL fold metallo-hydrolase [Rhodospirillaceae bacterium]MBT5082059.1 MBL fold metallo-hydrolase [Rhodospirillaceae bacterium]MBT5524733.1 MBL fold metallo-hydrolase [Rhodospirillaceae bacterium]